MESVGKMQIFNSKDDLPVSSISDPVFDGNDVEYLFPVNFRVFKI